MKIQVIAFDGLNRCGKGTQLAILARLLNERKIPNITLRGDGSREGSGLHEGDPTSEWWQRFRQEEKLCVEETARFTLWNQAAAILAKEMLVWKQYGLPLKASQMDKETGVLLLDRSLVSRCILLEDANERLEVDHLYPIKPDVKDFHWTQVLPDQIIVLDTDQETLLGRLETSDPKYEFRRRLIADMYSVYQGVMSNLPKPIRDRTAIVDGGQDVLTVHRNCLEILNPLLAG